MIHLNVAFLVIRSTLENIVKILINASPHAVNKYTRNGLFRTIIATIWRMECVPTVYLNIQSTKVSLIYRLAVIVNWYNYSVVQQLAASD